MGKSGYSNVDELCINTIRTLAVSSPFVPCFCVRGIGS